VVDKIAALPTRALGPFAGDVPNPIVVITGAEVVGDAAPASTVESAPASAAAPAKSAQTAKKTKPAAKG
jgi:peptidyl-prolyl cis-trans isomerase A (cyclophilin A)